MTLLDRFAGATDALRAAVLRMFGRPQLLSDGVRATGSVEDSAYVEDYDETLREHDAGREGLALYRRIRRQIPRVTGYFTLRFDAVMSLPHAWYPGDPDNPESRRVCKEVAAAWETGVKDRDVSIRKLLFCIADGVSFGQPVYGAHTIISDGKEVTLIIPVRILDEKPDPFRFSKDGSRLTYQPAFGDEIPVDPLQIIVARYGSAKPYGEGVMAAVHSSCWKHQKVDVMGMKALAKQGFPLLHVVAPDSWKPERIEELRRIYETWYPNCLVIPGPVDRIEKEILGKDSTPTLIGEDQIARMRELDDDISICILGFAFSRGDGGAYSRDKVGADMLFDKAAGDAAVYDGIANSWSDLTCMINYPTLPIGLRPRCKTDTKPTDDLVAWMNNLGVAIDKGFPASKKQISTKQGFDIATDEGDVMHPLYVKGASGRGQILTDPQQLPQDGQGVTLMAENGDRLQFESVEQFRQFIGSGAA